MSVHYPLSEFGITQERRALRSPSGAALAAIADEDQGLANPMLGFVIAIPIGLAFWALLIGAVALVPVG